MTGVLVFAPARRLLALVGAVFAALPVGSALADTTIGQVGADPNGACVSAPAVLADTNYVVPSGGGVISSFSFRSNSRNTDQRLDFLVLRPAGGGSSSYTVVGKTGLVTLKGTGGGTVETFPAGILAQGGDILGLWIPAKLDACVRGTSNGGGGFINSSSVESDPNVGQALPLPGVRTNIDLNESANLVTTSQAIGQVGGLPVFPNGCLGPIVQADTTYVVPPGRGFITSFSFQSDRGNEGQQIDFLVLRPAGNGNYMVIGQTGLVTLKGTQTGTTVETFPAGIAVQGGDILGFWFSNNLNRCARTVTGTGGAILSDFGESDPNVGETLSFSSPSEVDDSNESATVITLGEGGPPPPPPIVTKDQCRNGGWRDFPQFKNQGDCVSSLASGGKNPPSGS